MTYDFEIEILELAAGTPMKGTLASLGTHLCASITVGHRRYWEAVQADTRIDRAVRIPDGEAVTSSMFARMDGALWRIEEAQHASDEYGLPCTNLSLRRWEGSLHVLNESD